MIESGNKFPREEKNFEKNTLLPAPTLGRKNHSLHRRFSVPALFQHRLRSHRHSKDGDHSGGGHRPYRRRQFFRHRTDRRSRSVQKRRRGTGDRHQRFGGNNRTRISGDQHQDGLVSQAHLLRPHRTRRNGHTRQRIRLSELFHAKRTDVRQLSARRLRGQRTGNSDRDHPHGEHARPRLTENIGDRGKRKRQHLHRQSQRLCRRLFFRA